MGSDRPSDKFREIARLAEERDQARRSAEALSERLQRVLGSITDGHYILDKDWIFQDINLHALRYFGRNREQVIGRCLWDVFPTVKNSLVEKKLRQAMEDGEPVHIEFRSLIVPGRWVNLNAYPMQDGLFVVFSDISQQKENEEKINWLSSFPERNVNPVFELNEEGRVTYANLAMKRLLPDIETHGSRHAFFREALDFLRTTKNSEQNQARQIETEIDGAWYLLNLMYIAEFRRMRVYGFNISARKQAEREALRSKEDWANTFDTIPDLIAVIDDRHRIVRANKAMAEKMRASPEDAIGMRCYRGIHGTGAPPPFCPHAKLLMDGEERVTEIHEPRMGGDFLVSVTPIRDDDGKVRGCVHVARDISELKRKEKELQRLNRALRILTDTNQAILRATDETGYFEEACRITVSGGDYRMAWIGLAEDDERKTVRPVAHAGFEEGYLETLNLTWADVERGRGPTGTAIRTGKPAFCRDMLTDPNFKPWRAEALKRGYASSVVLPLIGVNRVLGAINIYSPDPDPFSEEEVGLLLELADNLARGIEVLRLQAATQKTGEALRESEARYRSLFEGMSEGFALHEIVCDESGVPVDYRFLELNPSFERLTGLKREELLGKLVSEIPVLRAESWKWAGIYGEVALTGQSIRFEEYSSGLDTYYEIFAYRPVPQQFAVLFMNVTERRRAEEALRESESKLNRAQEIAHLGSWDLDLAENRLSWSDEVYRIFGLQPQEFAATYEAFLDGVHPDDRAAVDRAYSNSLKEGRDSYEIEHRIVRKNDGAVRFVHEKCAHVRDGSGRIIRSVGMVHDITERKLAEEELQRTYAEISNEKKRLETIIDVLPVGFSLVDAHGGNIRSNQTYDDLWGLPRPIPRDVGDYSAYKAWWMTTGEPVQPEEWGSAIAVSKGEAAIGQFFEIEKFDGEHRFVMNSAVPIRNADGRITGSAVAIQDITDLKRTHDALRRHQEHLEDLVRERTAELKEKNASLLQKRDQIRILATELMYAEENERRRIAQGLHDFLGQKLAMFKLRLGMAIGQIADDRQREVVREIHDNLDDIIDETRNLYFDLRFETFFKEGLEPALRELGEKMMEQHKIAMKLESVGEPKSLSSYLVLNLYQIVRELLYNVVKHAKATQVNVAVHYDDQGVSVIVEDNGVGFDRDEIAKFLSSGKKFGLFGVKERIEGLYGEIDIDSAIGRGTMVSVHLPLAAD
ncbi:MAG: PAS domain S-box protein [Myxococcales bacterium]|nr:MAG: PAS domain S-box protein [Myxococcales bacterium]